MSVNKTNHAQINFVIVQSSQSSALFTNLKKIAMWKFSNFFIPSQADSFKWVVIYLSICLKSIH